MADQTLPLNVSNEMKADDERQNCVVMESDEELYSSSTTNACGDRCQIIPQKRCTYRPMYYTYKVVEIKYKKRYNEALGGMERYVVETKTCYVDGFSHWDFTHVSK